ncbi:hypothetical protein MTR67_027527 [Solanum verrucosum]|uniref:Uncharacterized protein n=1 Tax=Solanum verrucosum TaxID=315347 RepID=A0AAF0R595_SOLVR|nr:hypothetical protein MTR67_027527 [Solanum verrucosum]
MADNKPLISSSGDRRQPSRLQRRAPASIQVDRVTDWNVASVHKEEVKKEHTEKPVMVFKKWQHPASPFCYEPAPLVPFVCAGSADRR